MQLFKNLFAAGLNSLFQRSTFPQVAVWHPITAGVDRQRHGADAMHVNPHHVKKSKKLDDNNSSKSDHKDLKVIT